MSSVKSFRAARWLRTSNLVLQAILFVSFFAGLNYLALQLNWGRFDITELRKHSLSVETLSYLQQLKNPIEVIVTLTPNDDNPEVARAWNDVTELLREYTYATENRPEARITVTQVDVYQNPAATRRYNLQPNTVLFICGDHSRVLTLADLYTLKDQKREAFFGEQAFTAAILSVSNPDPKKIYFLSGHGETDPRDVKRGLSLLSESLRERNFDIDYLELARTRKIPDNAALIISVGAQNRYDAAEQELLRQYLSEKAGRFMLFLPPGLAPTGLEDLLFDWGLVADNVWIFDNDPAAQTDEGDLIINAYAPHPITQLVIDNKQPLRFGATRSIRPNPSSLHDPSRSVTRVVGTSATAWGERDYTRDRTFTPGADLRGPLGVVSVAERLAATEDLAFSVPVGRLVAFGSADFIANDRILEGGNATLFFSALNWLVDRDAQLNVPPRKIDKFQLSLSRQELLRLRYALLFGLPAAAALLGLLVYWTRRR